MDGHPAGTGKTGPADRTPPIGRLATTTRLTRVLCSGLHGVTRR